MKKTSILLSLLTIALATACGGGNRPAKNCSTFAEMADPTADTASTVWNDLEPGLYSAVGSTDIRYPKSLVPEEVNAGRTLSLTGWKGERLSGQFVLWTPDGSSQTECVIADFKSDAGARLSAGIARTRFVRYVMTDIFAPGCGYRKPEDFPASLAADMLDDIECFDIEARTTRPVWVTVDIPRDAALGTYKSRITVTSREHKKQTFDLELTVQDRLLPETKDWTYHLDLWQHPSAVARVHNLEMWSDEHFAAIRPYMEPLAAAGQKVITATLNKEPWNNQTLDPYADMIIWTKKTDGTWEYDYKVFDRWVELMMDLGITGQINCYSVVPWNNEIHYFDQQSDTLVNVKADPGTPAFREMWTPFLRDFIRHLDGKGWLAITNIAMDERSPEEMKEVISLMQDVAPELGMAFADNHKSYKEYPFAFRDLCVQVGAPLDSADIVYRREHGMITTYYVCCSNPFPNMFTFSDPAESVYAAWYAEAAGFDGFLRWAYNSWVENPLTDSRFRTWPAGDTYMIYPGAQSSIRLERIREGVQDVEKIKALRSSFARSSHSDDRDKLQLLNETVAAFNNIRDRDNTAGRVNEGKQMLNDLSR